jgi:hypothetical protein
VLLLDVEYLDPVEAGIGEVHQAARLVQQNISPSSLAARLDAVRISVIMV